MFPRIYPSPVLSLEIILGEQPCTIIPVASQALNAASMAACVWQAASVLLTGHWITKFESATVNVEEQVETSGSHVLV